jgi:maltose 6'-phosphate phosphatase
MNAIQLLYVENIISRKNRQTQQRLSFFLLIDNLGYNKQIDVLWQNEQGAWHTLPAAYHSRLKSGREYWLATAHFSLGSEQSLPGNIEFALRYKTSEQLFWDNNQGQNYTSQADSGIRVTADRPILQIGLNPKLTVQQHYLPITVAIDSSLKATKVTIHWTDDNWRTTRKTACYFKRNYWDKEFLSNARNPNHYRVGIWKGWLKVNQVFHLQYSICCEHPNGAIWDNNGGENYQLSRDPLKIMILNLHCYQEDHQDFKFSQIAKAVNDHAVDIVCFQEVAEPWNDGLGDFATNSAKIINDRLKQPFFLYSDWSHLGFGQYREGVAILSRYPLLKQSSRYVSESHDVYNIHARKVVMAQIQVPHIGLINIYSAHLSWWEDGFAEQFNSLRQWAADEQTAQVKASLLCGDFNIAAGSKGYRLVVDGHDYEDQFLAVNSHGVFEKIFRVNDPYWQQYLTDDYRIDYIFLHKKSKLQATSGQVLFTEQDYGRVSDHCGYLMTFEPRTD